MVGNDAASDIYMAVSKEYRDLSAMAFHNELTKRFTEAVHEQAAKETEQSERSASNQPGSEANSSAGIAQAQERSTNLTERKKVDDSRGSRCAAPFPLTCHASHLPQGGPCAE